MNASCWTVFFTALAAIAATAYTVITYFLFREAQHQTEGQIAPVLQVRFDSHTRKVEMENVGKGVAVKGRLAVTMEQDPNIAGQFSLPAEVDRKLSKAIPILGPGKTYKVNLSEHLPVIRGWDDGKFQAFLYHFRIEYTSTSGTRYFTDAHAEKGYLVQDRVSYTRVC